MIYANATHYNSNDCQARYTQPEYIVSGNL